MPYDSENKRLYVDTSVTPNIGISLKNISDCLRDYRRNSRGAIDLGMMCTSPNINLLSKYKPTDYPEPVRSEYYYMGDGAKDGYFLGYDCYGVKKPFMASGQFGTLGPNGVPTGNAMKIRGMWFPDLEADWGRSDIVWARVLDFDGYIQIPAPNRFTNSTNAFVASLSVLNPNGGIAGSAQLRYNWEDIVHEDGKSTTLGLKSLLACDGVNDKAYLGVAVYRSYTKTPNTGTALAPVAVAAIHTAPLGTTCPNTGMVEIHNVAFDFKEDGLISGYEGSITNGYTNFYIGEKGIKAIPFIAKWSGNTWYFVGLGVEPYLFPSALVAQGGSGSTKNNVEITKVVCKLTAVRNADGSIQVGIANNNDFAITVSGSGDLAFKKDNLFYITPADGNSTMRGQSGVRLGISDNEELDLPVTAVSAGTYYASSLMHGRTSSAGYQDAPSSVFVASGKFKVGFSIPYYKKLTTWTYLSGSVEINPSEITSGNPKTYTITIVP